MSITRKKYKLTKVGANTYYLELLFILLNIFQPQKLMKKVKLTETLFLSKKGHDADYEASKIQTFISKLKDRQINKLNKKFKNKKTEQKN